MGIRGFEGKILEASKGKSPNSRGKSSNSKGKSSNSRIRGENPRSFESVRLSAPPCPPCPARATGEAGFPRSFEFGGEILEFEGKILEFEGEILEASRKTRILQH